ncbi:MAG: energy transducer TonB [Bryobacteraceae bacterium]
MRPSLFHPQLALAIAVAGLAVLPSLAQWRRIPVPQREADIRQVRTAPAPAYPEAARTVGVEGLVKFIATVSAEGAVTNLEFVSGHPALARAAENAIRHWRYRAADSETTFPVAVDFTDDDPDVPPVEGGNSLLPESTHTGPDQTPPLVKFKPAPEYSEEARKAHIEGKVIARAEVGVDGRLHGIRVVCGAGFGLDEKAIESIKRWRFRPAEKDGQPIPFTATFEVAFRLIDKLPRPASRRGGDLVQ